MAKYVAPEHQVTSFTCPRSGTLTSQEWEDLTAGGSSTEISQSVCYECQEPTYWYDDWMLYPLTGNTPAPHDDMPRNAKDLYVEAQAIVTRSPRSACALLRIAIQEICEELGQKDVRLFEAIGNLVKEGRINERTQKALDAVRVRAGELSAPRPDQHGRNRYDREPALHARQRPRRGGDRRRQRDQRGLCHADPGSACLHREAGRQDCDLALFYIGFPLPLDSFRRMKMAACSTRNRCTQRMSNLLLSSRLISVH